MRLFITRPSPFARKAWAAVLELGMEERVEIVELPPRMPKVPKPDLEALNPLGKVPTLVRADGDLLVDSRVIVALLDDLAGGGRLVPRGQRRWAALTLEALADGCMEAGIVLRVESLKDERLRDLDEVAAYRAKIDRSFDYIESQPRLLEDDFHVGLLALACVADWLVFRDIVPDPLASRPGIARRLSQLRERPSLAGTRPSL